MCVPFPLLLPTPITSSCPVSSGPPGENYLRGQQHPSTLGGQPLSMSFGSFNPPFLTLSGLISVSHGSPFFQSCFFFYIYIHLGDRLQAPHNDPGSTLKVYTHSSHSVFCSSNTPPKCMHTCACVHLRAHTHTHHCHLHCTVVLPLSVLPHSIFTAMTLH